MDETRKRIGRAGEFLVLFDLHLKGFHAFHANNVVPYDTLVDIDGHMVRVQTKSTGGPKEERHGTVNRYQFRMLHHNITDGNRPIEAREADVFAFAFLDIRQVAYVRVEDLCAGEGEDQVRGTIRWRSVRTSPGATGRFIVENYSMFPYQSQKVPF